MGLIYDNSESPKSDQKKNELLIHYSWEEFFLARKSMKIPVVNFLQCDGWGLSNKD